MFKGASPLRARPSLPLIVFCKLKGTAAALGQVGIRMGLTPFAQEGQKQIDATAQTARPFAGRWLRVPLLAIFGICVGLSFFVWGTIAAQYLWPVLRTLPRSRALRLLLLVHSFRFIGLAFLVPGVVSPDLPAEFARPAAYGDLIAAILALVAFTGLASKFGISLVWVFNLWGIADLLYAFYQGLFGVGIKPDQLGAAFFIPTVAVPLLFVTHVLVFQLLLMRGDGETASSQDPSSLAENNSSTKR
jgi:hypothetical protein